MADKQLLMKQNAEDGFFADDDPLAALARIASFDPQGEIRPKLSNQRREPEFNLEDELLKEFEQYESPVETELLRDDAQQDARSTDEFSEEPALLEPVLTPQPVRDFPELRAVPESSFAMPVEPVRPVSHPVFDLEDEILREFAAFDARRAAPPAIADAQSAFVPTVTPERQPSLAPAGSMVQPAVSRVEPEFDNRQEVEDFQSHNAHAGYGDDDLTVETEVMPDSMASDTPALDAMEAEVDTARWSHTKAPVFKVDDIFAERQVDEPAAFESDPAADDIRPASYSQSNDVVIHSTSDAISGFEPVVPKANASATATPLVAAGNDDFGLDALLDDIERYPVADAPARWSKPPTPMPVVSTEKPVEAMSIGNAIAMPVQTPIAPKAQSIPVVAPIPDPPIAEKAVLSAADAFDESAFELDLSEIELDMLELEVEAPVSPAPLRGPVIASPAALADVAKAVVDERQSYSVERTFVPAVHSAEDYSSLPFDPSQISSEEDPVEALTEMDVPEIAIIDHENQAPAHPDYDIDIDAEMAHIFSRPAEPAHRPISAQSMTSSKAASAAASMSSTDIDEFERALEEDFRRSLSENRATSTPDRVALTPSSYEESRRESPVGRRLMVLAASVAGLVLIGGAAVYAYWGNPGKILSTSSEPKIILADKDPVKIEPKDRGGQTVPNQDKVVYDRVSGDDKDVTKQEKLVTSNEEPVDVVQKTLLPETLPMDDEDNTNTTDTNDTTDSRLLPDGQDKNITTTEKVVSGVSPRKVRTMVVRSDGTLVARDEPAADAVKETTPAEASQERSLEITPAATENVPDRLSANDAVAKQIEEASADTKSFVPEMKTPADAVESKPAQIDDVSAVQNDQPAVKADEKPVVAEDTTAVPVKQDQGVATPLTATDETATSDAVKPADQDAIKDAADADVEETAPIRTVKTTKISANTPIPENRPVDQPVDIVGRVTDQGNVQKTQEVANADPVQPTDNSQSVRPTTTPSGAYVIQIASLPSEAEAQNSYKKLSAKFSSVIGGRGVDIKKASVKNKGTYYRVRIPVGSRQEATDLCLRYKSAGGSCLVSK